MKSSLENIAQYLEEQLSRQMTKSGLMFRLFFRVKTFSSIQHKVKFKGELYRTGKAIMQDVIGFRIVVYFTDDVDVVSCSLSSNGLVRRSVDEPDSTTFRPQRLNLTRNLPAQFVDDFRKSLPVEYAQYIDNTYEIQIRTVFSEGWHEVEHDLRYKCKDDWEGCESYSRTLNGVIATLETAEWGMKSLFHELAHQNYRTGNYRAMLRNKMRIRLKGDDFSPVVSDFLRDNPMVAKGVIKTDRMLFVLALMEHAGSIELTYDNVLFLVNRMDIHNEALMALEGEAVRREIDAFLQS